MALFLACVSSRSKTKKPSKSNPGPLPWPWDWSEGSAAKGDILEEECTTPSSLESDEEEVATPTGGPAVGALEPQACGLRRDLTLTFQRLRTAGRSPVHRRRHSSSASATAGASAEVAATVSSNTSVATASTAASTGTQSSSSSGSAPGLSGGDAASKLEEIFEQASSAESSLSSRLAQHRGLVQFGSEFGGSRPPPLELRAALPEVEHSIEERLEELRALLVRLRRMEVDTEGGRHAQIRQALATRIEKCLEETEPDYEEQKKTLEKLQQSSPLLAPALSEELLQSLASKLASPASSRGPSAAASPRLSGAAGPGAWAASPPSRALQGHPLPELSKLPLAFSSLEARSSLPGGGAVGEVGEVVGESIFASAPGAIDAFQSQASFEMLIADWDP